MFNSVIDRLAETADREDISFFQPGTFIRDDTAVDQNLLSAEERGSLRTGKACKSSKNRVQPLGGYIEAQLLIAGPEFRSFRFRVPLPWRLDAPWRCRTR